MTRTDSSTGAQTRIGSVQAHPRCSRSSDCRCGQQLDLCAGSHCPRCGRVVKHR